MPLGDLDLRGDFSLKKGASERRDDCPAVLPVKAGARLAGAPGGEGQGLPGIDGVGDPGAPEQRLQVPPKTLPQHLAGTLALAAGAHHEFVQIRGAP